MKLDQREVDDACEAAYQRFASLPPTMAALVFSYTLQGFGKYMAENGWSRAEFRRKIIELLDLVDKANE